MNREQGSVLLCALMVMALIAIIGAGLSLFVSSESAIAANYVASQRGLFAAEAASERAIAELRLLPAWSTLPAATTQTSIGKFDDGLTNPRAPDGSVLNLAQLTLKRQAESDAMYAASPDRPIWHLYAHAPLDQIAPAADGAPPYVVVWLADDVDDGDANPNVDGNDVVLLHAEAFGIRSGKRAIDVTIQREQAMAAGIPGAIRSDVRVIAWREVR